MSLVTSSRVSRLVVGAILVALAVAPLLASQARAQTGGGGNNGSNARGGGNGGGGGVEPAQPTSSLTLASQTPWVDPVKTPVFDMRVAISTPVPADAVQIVVSVFGRLTTRSDFARTLSDSFTGYEIAQPIGATLDTLHPDANGIIDIAIPVTNGAERASSVLFLSTSGVYPVTVELRPRGGGKRLARLITTMLYTATPVTGPPLHVVWVAPIHTAPPDPKSNQQGVSPADDAKVTALADALAAHPSVPATLQITADTLTGLSHTDPALVSRIGRSLDGREVLAGTWVPVSLPAMLNAGLSAQASLSLTRSTDELSTDLGTQVANRSWVEDGLINQDALTFLREAQFDRVVLPETDLDPNPLKFTMAQPFVVAGSDRTVIRAGVADAGLQSHFFNGGDQMLAAHQLLADLYQIYSDAPANNRGVIVVTPRSWIPNAGFLDAWLTGMDASPLLSGTTLDSFFDAIPPAFGRDGLPLIRQVVSDTAAIKSDSADLLADGQRQARGQLAALATSLPDNTVVYPRLERLLLEVPSVDVQAADRRTLLDALNHGIQAETHLIVIAGPRTITLTARTGRLPLNLVSQSDEPVKVVLRVESDKLELPGIGPTGRAEVPKTLHKGNNPLDLAVKARTPGAFAVNLTVLTPGGSLIITQTKLTVQSTALSGVGVVLSVGAALFLLVWWARHAWRSGRGAHTKAASRKEQ